MDNVLRARVGRGSRIDPQAIVGYHADRPGRRGPLVLGANAVVRSGSVIYEGSKIGPGFQTGHHVIVREDNVLGRDVHMWSNGYVDYGCVIGSRILMHVGVYVAQFTRIEDDVFLAPHVALANDRWPIDRSALEGPVIERWARIGMNATILPGVRIGYGALVGAGSVVTKDVPRWGIAVGVPARVVGTVPVEKRRRA